MRWDVPLSQFGPVVMLGLGLFFAAILVAVLRRPARAPRRGGVRYTQFDTRGSAFGGGRVSEPAPSSRPGGQDHRGAVRRAGNPTPVWVAGDGQYGRPDYALVLDRSTTGLRLAVSRDIRPGSLLSVRAESAPEDSPWVFVEVRHARSSGKFYEIGCRFVESPPWSVLLLFG